jgi:16S rRNA (guanine527-N7)-methyltransferase
MFHVKHAGIPLTDAQIGALERYATLLEERAVPLGMIAESDVGRLRTRHVDDALRGAPLLPQGEVVDLGSGAGLPGIPLAIARPDVSMLLVEARRNRAAFLELVLDDLALPNARVHAGRVEDLPGPFAACVARAFAAPQRTWDVAKPLLGDGGILLYWAGVRFDPERDVPAGAVVHVLTSELANAGPIAIMTRQ